MKSKGSRKVAWLPGEGGEGLSLEDGVGGVEQVHPPGINKMHHKVSWKGNFGAT